MKKQMIIIKKRTKVYSEKRGLIELLDDVCELAERQTDGSFLYSVCGNKYMVSAGCCRFGTHVPH